MKLHIGCGLDKRKGYLNTDICESVKPDLILDLNVFPYPFEDNQFEEVLALAVLEHIPKHNLLKCIQELYRISKPNATWNISVPFYNGRCARGNLIHYTGFDFTSFDCFKPEGKYRDFQYYGVKLKVKEVIGTPTSRGRFIPFKMFLRHTLGELYNLLEFKLEVIK